MLLLPLVLTSLSCEEAFQPQPAPETAEFLLLDGEGPGAGGSYSSELGVNTIPIFADNWAAAEPVDNNWSWDGFFPDNRDAYDHCILRIGVLHTLAWGTANIPGWVNTGDLDGEFKTQYGEFVRAVVDQAIQRGLSIDYYLVELEANYAGHELPGHPEITNAWIINWIKWESDLIKSLDPRAKIVIPLTPTEFRPEESLDNTGDLGKILLADFVERLIQSGVSFEAFGFNVASGVYDKIDDTATLEAFLTGWSTIEKEIFVWALGYPADNDDHLPFNNPRPAGYSEAWQSQQYVNSLQLFLDNPKVIGASLDLYDYTEAGWATPVHWGLVSGESSSPVHSKRPGFDAVKAYWLNNFR